VNELYQLDRTNIKTRSNIDKTIYIENVQIYILHYSNNMTTLQFTLQYGKQNETISIEANATLGKENINDIFI
jgi:hypothetical protein